MHFMVRLPEEHAAPVDVSEDNRIRIQGLLSEAARTWTDRLIGAAASGSVEQADAEHYADRLPRGLQTGRHARTMPSTTSRIIEELQDDSVKLVFSERGEDWRRPADLVHGRTRPPR